MFDIKGHTIKKIEQEVLKMKAKRQQLTNMQMSAAGNNRIDNGEIEHKAEKKAKSKKNDNVKPRANN